MLALHEKYIEILEEYDDIRAYDKAKSFSSEPVEWKKAKKIIVIDADHRKDIYR